MKLEITNRLITKAISRLVSSGWILKQDYLFNHISYGGKFSPHLDEVLIYIAFIYTFPRVILRQLMQREGAVMNRMALHSEHVTTVTDNYENHNYINNDAA